MSTASAAVAALTTAATTGTPTKTAPAPAPSSTTSSPAKAASKPDEKKKDEKAKTPVPETAPVEEDDDEPEDTATSDDDIINMDIFGQIIELDDEGDYEFSWEMVTAYFGQVKTTFKELDEEFEAKNLKRLSELGHFLKGSSAALGVRKVQDTCEKVQHYGELRDEEADKSLKPEEALVLMKPLLKNVKREFAQAKKWLLNWFVEHDHEDAKDYND